MAEHSGQSITCPSCGKALRWREEQVGRKMKCACGQVFTMPATPGPVEPAASRKAPPLPSASPPPAAPPSPFDDGAFELDLPDSMQSPGPSIGGTCPSCKAPMKAGAVLCIRCGFHTVTGNKLNTGTGGRDHVEAGRRQASDQALLDEEKDHRFTELYLPVAMIIVGVIVTVIRAYSGMGSSMSHYEEEEEIEFNSPLFPQQPGGPMFEDMEEQGPDEGEPQTLKDAAKGNENAPAQDGKDADAKDDAPAKDERIEKEPDGEVEAPDVGEQPKVEKSSPFTHQRPPPKKAAAGGFNTSPLIVAGFSLLFQVLVMVPVVFACVLFVAKFVDVSFGSLPSVLLKITAVVLGPMAVADWIDDVLLSVTMGMGFVLSWTIRLVLVGSSLIKLFDLDFFEAMVLMIVVAVVRFILGMVLIFALASMFLHAMASG